MAGLRRSTTCALIAFAFQFFFLSVLLARIPRPTAALLRWSFPRHSSGLLLSRSRTEPPCSFCFCACREESRSSRRHRACFTSAPTLRTSGPVDNVLSSSKICCTQTLRHCLSTYESFLWHLVKNPRCKRISWTPGYGDRSKKVWAAAGDTRTPTTLCTCIGCERRRGSASSVSVEGVTASSVGPASSPFAVG